MREARIAESYPQVRALAGGGDAAALIRALRAAIGAAAHTPQRHPGLVPGPSFSAPLPREQMFATPGRPDERIVGILSFGLAGALHPVLRVGDWVVGISSTGGIEHDCNPVWAAALLAWLNRQPGFVPGQCSGGSAVVPPTAAKAAPSRNGSGTTGREARIHHGPVFANGALAPTAQGKRDLHAATGALAIDMESHVAARVAADHGLPFAILRVVSDTAVDTLPPAFAVAMTPDGGTDIAGMLFSLARQPGQIPQFVRAAWQGRAALASLLRGYRSLGPALLPPDVGQCAADMI